MAQSECISQDQEKALSPVIQHHNLLATPDIEIGVEEGIYSDEFDNDQDGNVPGLN
jgi:hypothetical protein